jgi:hypothetical protein
MVGRPLPGIVGDLGRFDQADHVSCRRTAFGSVLKLERMLPQARDVEPAGDRAQR